MFRRPFARPFRRALAGKIPPALHRPGTSAEKPKPILPIHCPGCDGPIRSDEVEWADDATAECPYCGSAVRAEK
jgi:hypothetical protein